MKMLMKPRVLRDFTLRSWGIREVYVKKRGIALIERLVVLVDISVVLVERFGEGRQNYFPQNNCKIHSTSGISKKAFKPWATL